MYPVSAAFLEVIQKNTRTYFWDGQIVTKDGKTTRFSPKDIVRGSSYLSFQCCGNTEIELGSVYASELGLTLFSEIDQHLLQGAEVTLAFHLKLPDGTFETVPMGVFFVSEANRTTHCLELKAYDAMLNFDKAFRNLEVTGTAYELISLCCTACKVELATAKAEIDALPNGAEVLSIYPDCDIETYRDVLYYTGQVLGAFFHINREGKLALVHYGLEPVMTLEAKHRFSSSFSDFATRYTAVYSTNMLTKESEYYSLVPDDGLTMNLGINPLLQFGLAKTRAAFCQNILADVAKINVVPFDSSTIGNPALDVGDVLRFTGGQTEEQSFITSMEVRIGGKQRLKCVGKDPALASSKSKGDKNISGLLNQIDAAKIGMRTFANGSEIALDAKEALLFNVDFASGSETDVEFHGEAVIDITADMVTREATVTGEVTIPSVNVYSPPPDPPEDPALVGATAEQTLSVSLPVSWTEDGKARVQGRYVLNDEEITTFYPEETWGSGKHLLPLHFPITKVLPNVLNSLKVFLKLTGSTGKIAPGSALSSISGQGMAAKSAWDSTIT